MRRRFESLRIANRSLAKRLLILSFSYSLVCVSLSNSYGDAFEEGVLRDAVEGERERGVRVPDTLVHDADVTDAEDGDIEVGIARPGGDYGTSGGAR